MISLPVLFVIVWVGENRRNATWEGHILTRRKCCAPNGSKKRFSGLKPPPPVGVESFFTQQPHLQRSALSLENIFSILLASFLLWKPSSSIGCECFVCWVVVWLMGEANTISLSRYMRTNIKVFSRTQRQRGERREKQFGYLPSELTHHSWVL